MHKTNQGVLLGTDEKDWKKVTCCSKLKERGLTVTEFKGRMLYTGIHRVDASFKKEEIVESARRFNFEDRNEEEFAPQYRTGRTEHVKAA